MGRTGIGCRSRSRSLRIVAAGLMLLAGVPAASQSAAEVPRLLDFGAVAPNAVVARSFVLARPRNTGTAAVSFVSSCDCLEVQPTALVLEPGDRLRISVLFDSTGYSGSVRKAVLVRATVPELTGTIMVVAEVQPGTRGLPCATCDEHERSSGSLKHLEEQPAAAQQPLREAMVLELYFDPGCRHCEDLIRDELPGIAREHGRSLRVLRRDVLDPADMGDLVRRMDSASVPLRELPVAFVEGRVYQGFQDIRSGVRRLLSGGGPEAPRSPEGADPAGPRGVALRALPVAAAGLVDGINPCVFSTILFLVSLLAVAGRKRRQILLTGIVYTAVVYLGYFAVGVGLLASVRRLLVFPSVAGALRWVLAAALAVLAGISIRDALLAFRGGEKEALLQLPQRFRERIHTIVRGQVRTASLLAGTAVMAVLVTVFEFSCTGQVYLPVILHLARTAERGRGLALLALYNTAFILPLAAVFAVAYAGVAVRPVAAFFGRRIALAKLLMAAVFGGFAVLTLLS